MVTHFVPFVDDGAFICQLCVRWIRFAMSERRNEIRFTCAPIFVQMATALERKRQKKPRAQCIHICETVKFDGTQKPNTENFIWGFYVSGPMINKPHYEWISQSYAEIIGSTKSTASLEAIEATPHERVKITTYKNVKITSSLPCFTSATNKRTSIMRPID